MEDSKLKKIYDQVKEKPHVDFSVDGQVMKFRNRLCVPNIPQLKQQILDEHHMSKLACHPGVTKMYQSFKLQILDEHHTSKLACHPVVTKMYRSLRQLYWWMGMKKEVVDVCHVNRSKRNDENPLVYYSHYLYLKESEKT